MVTKTLRKTITHGYKKLKEHGHFYFLFSHLAVDR